MKTTICLNHKIKINLNKILIVVKIKVNKEIIVVFKGNRLNNNNKIIVMNSRQREKQYKLGII